MGAQWSSHVTQCITGKGAFSVDYRLTGTPEEAQEVQQEQIRLHHKGSRLMSMIGTGTSNLDETIKRHEDNIDHLSRLAFEAMQRMPGPVGRREASKHIRARRNTQTHVNWLYTMSNNLQVFSHKIEQARLVGDTGRLVTDVSKYMKEETMSSGIDPDKLEDKMEKIMDMQGLLDDATECLSTLSQQSSSESRLDMDDEELGAELDAIAMQLNGSCDTGMGYAGSGGGGYPPPNNSVGVPYHRTPMSVRATPEYTEPSVDAGEFTGHTTVPLLAEAVHTETARSEGDGGVIPEEEGEPIGSEISEERTLYPPVPVGHPPAIVRTSHEA